MLIRSLLVASLLVVAFGAPSEASRTPADPFVLYGDGLAFTVLRDGREVGSHVTRFSREEGGVRVDSIFSIAVPFLFFTAYRFDYRSSALWRGGRLQSLSARVDDDGERREIRAARSGDGMAVDVDGRPTLLSEPPFVTNHWNPDVIGATEVLNTLTGRLARVTMIDHGLETIETEQGPREARRYAYAGDLRAEVWYDAGGRWVKLRFQARDGSTISYRCRQCGLP